MQERHVLGKYEAMFAADAARLRRLFAAGVPVIAMGFDRYRIAGPLPDGFVWDLEEE